MLAFNWLRQEVLLCLDRGAVGASGLVPARPDFGSGRGFISTILKSPILVCGSCRQIELDALDRSLPAPWRHHRADAGQRRHVRRFARFCVAVAARNRLKTGIVTAKDDVAAAISLDLSDQGA